ncbi:MAG: uridylate kinase [Methanocella sp. PtaU1.Bin125]|nr:MAG: uridylate kinase [Methanocella sp. PtaU1.Bin125]
MIVLKIGGSLFDSSKELLRKVAAEGLDVLVVPGGGAFADAVRDVYSRGGLSDDAAHWMALLAMDQYGYYLADGTDVPLSDKITGKGTRIALAYEILRKDDALPHSWDVTSDTIAAWMASKSGARLIKATDVDGVFKDGRLSDTISARELQTMGETCVDMALPGFLIEHGMDAFVVNGRCVPRVIAAIKGEETTGTVIKGK